MQNYQKLYKRELVNRNYAPNTIRNYSSYLTKFLQFAQNSNMKPDDRIADFLQNQLSTNEQRRIAWSAIKLFYRIILHKKCPYQLNSIRSRKRIPQTLDREEIIQLLNSISNNKDRTMIAMLYGSGLRVSEVCSIKIKDLDFSLNKLTIRDSKNHKDRLTLLSANLNMDLMQIIHNRRANEYLFLNQSEKKYSIRTVQKIFSNALERSGLQKTPTCHTLRHSFATHLVEKGINIKTIQQLLGHKSIKTTMIYIQISDLRIKDLESPL